MCSCRIIKSSTHDRSKLKLLACSDLPAMAEHSEHSEQCTVAIGCAPKAEYWGGDSLLLGIWLPFRYLNITILTAARAACRSPRGTSGHYCTMGKVKLAIGTSTRYSTTDLIDGDSTLVHKPAASMHRKCCLGHSSARPLNQVAPSHAHHQLHHS